MPDLWEYIKSLFRGAEQSTAQQPLIHEVIERSEAEQKEYHRWKNSRACHRLLDWINHQYVSYLVDPEHSEDAIIFLETPSAKGFIIYFRHMKYSHQEIIHFFDLLKERVLTLQYRSYLSDTRTYANKQWVENLQRHYLKPRIDRNEMSRQQPLPQQYGNINIELLARNDEVWSVKFSATSYHDRMYQKADEFKELMTDLLMAE